MFNDAYYIFAYIVVIAILVAHQWCMYENFVYVI
jgi:hypothetical protein